MKKKVSDNQLILIVIVAVFISLFSLLVSLTKLNITGASSSGEGYVNVTVIAGVAITIHLDTINFTAASPGQSRNSYNSSEVQNCDADNYCGMNMSNDGTVFINITIQETENLFESSNYDAQKHFTYNITMNDQSYTTAYGANGNCSVGYDQGLTGVGGWGYWRALPGDSAEVAICYLNYTNEPPDGNDDHRPDMARVELNITVPTDESPKSLVGTLTFTGVAA